MFNGDQNHTMPAMRQHRDRTLDDHQALKKRLSAELAEFDLSHSTIEFEWDDELCRDSDEHLGSVGKVRFQKNSKHSNHQIVVSKAFCNSRIRSTTDRRLLAFLPFF